MHAPGKVEFFNIDSVQSATDPLVIMFEYSSELPMLLTIPAGIAIRSAQMRAQLFTLESTSLTVIWGLGVSCNSVLLPITCI